MNEVNPRGESIPPGCVSDGDDYYQRIESARPPAWLREPPVAGYFSLFDISSQVPPPVRRPESTVAADPRLVAWMTHELDLTRRGQEMLHRVSPAFSRPKGSGGDVRPPGLGLTRSSSGASYRFDADQILIDADHSVGPAGFAKLAMEGLALAAFFRHFSPAERVPLCQQLSVIIRDEWLRHRTEADNLFDRPTADGRSFIEFTAGMLGVEGGLLAETIDNVTIRAGQTWWPRAVDGFQILQLLATVFSGLAGRTHPPDSLEPYYDEYFQDRQKTAAKTIA